MEQPTAEAALEELEALVGEWSLKAGPPGGPPWPGEGRASIEWMEGRQHLMVRSSVDDPSAPNGTMIIGCDAANGTYTQLYADDRGVCRTYDMSIGSGEWKLWREGKPFSQRFSAAISEDGNTIAGRWEKKTHTGWETDFDLTYMRAGQAR